MKKQRQWKGYKQGGRCAGKGGAACAATLPMWLFALLAQVYLVYIMSAYAVVLTTRHSAQNSLTVSLFAVCVADQKCLARNGDLVFRLYEAAEYGAALSDAEATRLACEEAYQRFTEIFVQNLNQAVTAVSVNTFAMENVFAGKGQTQRYAYSGTTSAVPTGTESRLYAQVELDVTFPLFGERKLILEETVALQWDEG